MNKIAPYYKAVAGFLVPFLSALGSALLEVSDGGSNITTSEWISALVLAMISGGAVFSIPNKDPNALHQDESVQPPFRGEAGETDIIGLLVGCLVVVVLVLLIIRLV